MLPEFIRGAVLQAGMWSDLVVVEAPLLDDHPRLGHFREPFEVQALVAQQPAGTLIGTFPPRFAKIDAGHLHPGFDDSLEDVFAEELRSVVAAIDARRAAQANQPSQNIDHRLERIRAAT